MKATTPFFAPTRVRFGRHRASSIPRLVFGDLDDDDDDDDDDDYTRVAHPLVVLSRLFYVRD